MESGKILAIIAGIITLLGTYVFALAGVSGYVSSGIGLIYGYYNNLADLFLDSATYSSGINPILYWVFIILFVIWLASGVLQFIGIKSRVAMFIFSLFPLTLGIVFMLAFYVPTVFGGISGPLYGLFYYSSVGVQYGGFFPILVNLGDAGLGVYFLIAGGVLGIISVFLPRD